MIRRYLLALLLAAGLLVAPFAMANGAAMAMMPDDQPMSMPDDGCGHDMGDKQQQLPGKGKMADACCTAFCAGFAVLPTMAAAIPMTANAAPVLGLSRNFSDIIGELATPPPRQS